MKKEMAAPSRAAFQVDLADDDRADAVAAQVGKWLAVWMFLNGYATAESTEQKFDFHPEWYSA